MAYQSSPSQDKHRQRSELQRNIAMLGSDIGKENAKKRQLEAEIRELKKEEDRAEVELQAKQSELQKVEREIAALDSSVKGLQKKLNLV